MVRVPNENSSGLLSSKNRLCRNEQRLGDTTRLFHEHESLTKSTSRTLEHRNFVPFRRDFAVSDVLVPGRAF